MTQAQDPVLTTETKCRVDEEERRSRIEMIELTAAELEEDGDDEGRHLGLARSREVAVALKQRSAFMKGGSTM